MPHFSESVQALITPEQERTEEEQRKHEEEIERLIEESRRNPILRSIESGLRQARASAASVISAGLAARVGAPQTLFEPQEMQAVREELAEGARESSRESFEEVQRLSQFSADADELSGFNATAGKAIRGATSSLVQAGVLAPAGPVGVIGGFTVTAANDAIKQAEDAGLDEKEQLDFAMRAALIEGGVTALFQGAGRVFGNGLGGFESLFAAKAAVKEGFSQAAKAAGKGSVAELAEEEIIGFMGAYNTALSGVDPDAITPESLREMAIDTAATTFLAFGTAQAGRTAIDQTRRKIAELPENPSRKQFSEALGVEPNKIDPALRSKEGREQARQEAVQEVSDDTQAIRETAEQAAQAPVVEAPVQEVVPEPVVAPEVIDDDVQRVPGEVDVLEGGTQIEEQTAALVEQDPDVIAEREIHEESLVGEQADLDDRVFQLSETKQDSLDDPQEALMPDGTPYSEEVSGWEDLSNEKREQIIEEDFEAAQTALEDDSRVRVEGMVATDDLLLNRAQERARQTIKLTDVEPLTAPEAIDSKLTALDRIQEEQRVDPGQIVGPEGEAIDPGTAGAILLPGRRDPKAQDTRDITELDPDDANVVRRREKAFIQPTEKKKAAFNSWLRTAVNNITRANTNLPESALLAKVRIEGGTTQDVIDMAPARSITGNMRDALTRSVTDADARIEATLNPLEGNQFDFVLLSNYIQALDAVESFDRGEPLRHGFSIDVMRRWLDKLQARIDSEPRVQQAYDIRKVLAQEVAQNLEERNMLPEGVQRDEYYRHQIRKFAMAEGTERGRQQFARFQKSFQKGRVKARKTETGEDVSLAEEFDYNTDYIGAERDFYIRANMAIEIEDALGQFKEIYDRMGEFAPLAKEHNDALVEEHGLSLQELYDQGFDVQTAEALGVQSDPNLTAWQPEEGTVWYNALSLTEKMEEDVNIALAENNPFGLDSVTTRKILAMGGRKETWLIPQQLADHFNSMTTEKEAGLVSDLNARAVAATKLWFLFSPFRFVGYNTRNTFGDLDPLLFSNPAALLKVPRAVRELWNTTILGKAPTRLLKEAEEDGVIGVGEVNADISKKARETGLRDFYPKAERWIDRRLDGLKDFTADPRDIPVRTLESLLKPFILLSTMRENMFRYATYIDYRERLSSGKKFSYGASHIESMDEVRRALGNRRMAADMTNDQLGNYRDITVAAQTARKHFIPFWAFTETVIKRYPRMIINNFSKKRSDNIVVDKALATLAMSRMMSLYGGAFLFNHLHHPDEEERLSEYEKNTPHLIVGNLDDDNIAIIRNISSLGELGEWPGANDLVSHAMTGFEGIKAGQETPEDLAMGAFKNFISKAYSGITPTIKTPIELLFGISTFPDPTNIRDTPRDTIIASTLGMNDLYNEAKGLVLKDGSSAREHMLMRWVFGVSNANANALSEQYDLSAKFLKIKGENAPSGGGLSEHRNIKLSLQNNNKRAFNDAIRLYLEDDKDFSSFDAIMKRLDPIPGRLKDEIEQEYIDDFLTPEQRVRYGEVRKYTNKLRDRGWTWFEQAVEEIGPKAVEKFRANKAKRLVSIVAPLGQSFITPSGRRLPKEKHAALLKKQELALAELESLDLTPEDVSDALKLFNKINPKSKDKSPNFSRRVMRRVTTSEGS